MRRVTGALAGAFAGCAVAALLWWPLLALFVLVVSGSDAFSGERLARQVRMPNGAVLVSVLPALGLIHGGITGAVRGRLGGGALVEAALSPFAWIMTAGEGMVGGLVMLASLVPGACLGGLAGLWLANVPTDATYWPPEAGVGAVVGVALSLLGLNLYVQWPTLFDKGEQQKPAPTEPPAPAEQQPPAPQSSQPSS
jgi:hypothetical protein